MPFRHRLALAVQIAAGRIAVLFYAPLAALVLRVAGAYRVRDLRRVREQFRQIAAETRAPLLLCPNHLTMIDSAIVSWALAPPWRYMRSYRLLPWNVPEQTNFAHPLVRAFCYLAKCLPIVRGGSRSSQRLVLAKLAERLRRGDLVLIFPEGRRSRSGRIDAEAVADGVGRLVKSAPGCAVLCIYLRGDAQDGHSALPRRGETFSLEMRLVRPTAAAHGVRGSRQIAGRVLAELADMEAAYFLRRRAPRLTPAFVGAAHAARQ